MRFIVSGCAGFIGSHLCEYLTNLGYKVTGIDSFSDFYPREFKEKNIEGLLKSPLFDFIEKDMLELRLEEIFEEYDAIFHLAAQPGVRTSWGKNFDYYIKDNIILTQRILEALKGLKGKRLVFASSSSVYGDSKMLPFKEDGPLSPVSPYGVTKLACENLCLLYHKNFGIDVVILRYFTVYGPRQRPDMAFHRFFRSILEGKEIEIFGDGNQTRDFTYVDDIVKATFSAWQKGISGEVYNLGGGENISLLNLLRIIENVTGKKLKISFREREKGDAPHTWADYSKAKKDLEYTPSVKLELGLKNQWEWTKKIYGEKK
jgi:UDP-glucose 4-epimerase